MNKMIIGLKGTDTKLHTLSVGTVFELWNDKVFYKGSTYGTFRDFCDNYEVCDTNRPIL